MSDVEIDRDTDGDLLIDWSPKPGRMVVLSLRSDGRLAYAFLWDGEQEHGTAQMPASVINTRGWQPPTDFAKTETPSIWARIFGRRHEDLDGCIVLSWRGKTWERNPGADDRWERTQ